MHFLQSIFKAMPVKALPQLQAMTMAYGLLGAVAASALSFGITLMTPSAAQADPGWAYRHEMNALQAWQARHPEWARNYPMQAQYFATHPDRAQLFYREYGDRWQDARAFQTWQGRHPEWVVNHPARDAYFNRHPERAERFERKYFWRHH